MTLTCPECSEPYFTEEISILLWRSASVTSGEDGGWVVRPNRRIPKEISDNEISPTGRIKCNECEHVFSKPLDKPLPGQLDLLA